MRAVFLLVLVLGLVLAGCGGGGGGGGAEDVTLPPGEGLTTPEVPTETGLVETGPNAATGGGTVGDEETAVDEPVSIEADDASITIVPLDDASSFMTLDLRRAGGAAAIKRGTCASPGETAQDLGEATRGTSEFLLDVAMDEVIGGDYVLTIGQDFCTALAGE